MTELTPLPCLCLSGFLACEREGAVPFQLSAELVAKITALCQRERTTTYIVLLSAFSMLLCRYSSQSEVRPISGCICDDSRSCLLIGADWVASGDARSPCYGQCNLVDRVMRVYVSMNCIIGLTMVSENAGCSLLCLHTRTGYWIPRQYGGVPLGMDETLSFSQLLRENRREVSESISHKDYPFSTLVEKMVVGRDPSRTPLFQVGLPMDNTSCSLTSPFSLYFSSRRNAMHRPCLPTGRAAAADAAGCCVTPTHARAATRLTSR